MTTIKHSEGSLEFLFRYAKLLDSSRYLSGIAVKDVNNGFQSLIFEFIKKSKAEIAHTDLACDFALFCDNSPFSATLALHENNGFMSMAEKYSLLMTMKTANNGELACQ